MDKRLMTDGEIRSIFDGAADFYARTIRCAEKELYLYAIDGLVASGWIADYVLKPLIQDING